MKTLGVGIGVIAMLVLTSNCFCDEIRIPFSIHEKAFKQELAKHGMRMDHSDNGDGFIEDRGGSMNVFSYHSFTPKQMEIIKDAAFKCERK